MHRESVLPENKVMDISTILVVPLRDFTNEIDWDEINRIQEKYEHIYRVDHGDVNGIIDNVDELISKITGKLCVQRYGRYITLTKVVKNVKPQYCDVYIEGEYYCNYHDFYTVCNMERDILAEVAKFQCSIDNVPFIEEECNSKVDIKDNENLFIFARAINIKNVKSFRSEDERLQAPTSDIEISYDGDNRMKINAKHIDLLENYMDITRAYYDVHIIDYKYAYAGSIIPLVMHEIENLMIAQDCINDLLPTFPDVLSVRTALSMPNSLAYDNYERLEILGDSILKLLVS